MGSEGKDATPTTVNDKNIYYEKSVRITMMDWVHVFGAQYLPRLFWASVVALFALFLHSLGEADISVVDVVETYQQTKISVLNMGWQGGLLALSLVLYFAYMRPRVYMLGFSCFDAPSDWRVTHEDLMTIMKNQEAFTEESLAFMEKILARGGTGDSTAWPPNLLNSLRNGGKSEDTVAEARNEFEQVVYPVIEDVLKKTNVKPKDIDFLVINCSLFSPTPSLCAMVALKFGFRSDVRTFNLSGMGCSASVISIDLAKHLLASSPNSTALVVSTENISRCLYRGQERGMLLQNTLFRCGAAAMMLSNKLSDSHRALYKLLYTVRTQRINPEAYECVFECQDSSKNQGIRLSKDIVKVAGKTLAANLTMLGPSILPFREMVKTAMYVGGARFCPLLHKKLLNSAFKSLAMWVPEKVQTYVPDFTRCIDHFCVHAGGRAVIDGIEKNLKLQPYHMEASRTTLREFGNTSSSSIWYELRAVEQAGKMKRGDRVLQIAFGSGFKCNSAVWIRVKK